MRILLLAYHYPPDRAVGSLRPAKVAGALRDAGHEVVVVTNRLPSEEGKVRHDEPGLRVLTVRPWRNPRELYLAAKQRSKSQPPAGKTADAIKPAQPVREPAFLPAWKRWLFSLFWLPDDRQGFIPAALRAVKLEVGADFDLIYTSAPPFSVHLAGLRLAQRARKPWAAEFRDPWTDNPWKPWHARSSFSDAAERWLEKRVLKRADHLIAVTEGIGDALRAKLPPARKDRVTIALNGIDRLLPRQGRVQEKLRILHVGTLYHKRDPRPFFDALADLRNEGRIDGTRVEVEFVGNCRYFGDVSVEKELETRGLGDMVRLRDWVPQTEVGTLIEHASVLLLLAQQQPAQVPNKLYEYLGTRIPILAFADWDGETARMLREVGGHYIIADESAESRNAVVADALKAGRTERVGPRDDVLESWRTERQMQKVLNAVGG